MKAPWDAAFRGAVTKVIVQPETLRWIIGTSKGLICTPAFGRRRGGLQMPIPTAPWVESIGFSPLDHNRLYVTFQTGTANADSLVYRDRSFE